uniref:Putative conserved secreted protein n=1 Tax=Culex tarsalis TaxID=7177 RepID=A0A1Q3FQY3_CULTA
MVSQRTACLSFVLIYCALWATCAFSAALSCDSCGRECASACGTRHFRTCCFNYLRKRSSTPPLAPPRNTLELPWLAKSRHDLLEGPPPLDSRSYADNELLEYVEVIRDSSGASSGNPRASDNKRNSLIASHSSGHTSLGKFRRPRPGADQDGRDTSRDSEMKTSEETDPGRLQLLYDA